MVRFIGARWVKYKICLSLLNISILIFLLFTFLIKWSNQHRWTCQRHRYISLTSGRASLHEHWISGAIKRKLRKMELALIADGLELYYLIAFSSASQLSTKKQLGHHWGERCRTRSITAFSHFAMFCPVWLSVMVHTTGIPFSCLSITISVKSGNCPTPEGLSVHDTKTFERTNYRYRDVLKAYLRTVQGHGLKH